MYYMAVAEDNNTRSMIDTWLGYNHNYRINNGEFYDMENMSTDAFPVLTPRKKRKLVHKIEPRVAKSGIDKTITYTLTDSEGIAIDAVVSNEMPENPQDGDYWLSTNVSEKKLYEWFDELENWIERQPFIKIEVQDTNLTMFEAGDKVNMNTGFDHLDNGSVIISIGQDYIVVRGLLYDKLGIPTLTREAKTTAIWQLKIEEAMAGYRGILYVDGQLAYIDGDKFYYGNGVMVDLAQFLDDSEKEGTEEQTMLEFGSYVLIYPLNIYINLADLSDSGRMTKSFEADRGVTITYTVCDSDGKDYDNLTVAETAPEDPQDGDYWLCTKQYSEGLNIWYQSKQMWTPVATTYLRLSIQGANFKKYFKIDDVVSMDTYLEDINHGSQIKAIGDDYLVFIGFVYDRAGHIVMQATQQTTDAWTLKIKQRLPKLDYVCTHKNRVWGCGYGYDVDRNYVNEIYCTKLGDFSSWYTYAGLSTDSYAVTVGAPGAWTGCISYNGYPTFFKADKIYRVFGNMPSEFAIDQIDARGVEYGSHKSLAILGEHLYYKASSGVMVFDGSLPVMISSQFGRDTQYTNAVAGASDNKYHIVVMNERGSYTYFVYDAEYGLWTKESTMNVTFFSGSVNGSMYACTPNGIYQVGVRTLEDTQSDFLSEEFVTWYAQTGEMGYEYPDFKYVSRLTLRAFLPKYSEIQVQISYDDRDFEDVGVLRGKEEIMSQSLTINPFRCDHYKLRFRGHGDVRIYSLAITLETGSEDYEYKN